MGKGYRALWCLQDQDKLDVALVNAVHYEQVSSVKLLLEHGADATVQFPVSLSIQGASSFVFLTDFAAALVSSPQSGQSVMDFAQSNKMRLILKVSSAHIPMHTSPSRSQTHYH
jgi:hypothetical protein